MSNPEETKPTVNRRPANSFDVKKFTILLGGMLAVLAVLGGVYLLLGSM